VDLAVGATGFERELIRRAPMESLGDVSIRVATAEDLLLMKILAGRPRDTEDARGIVSRGGDGLDWEHVLEIGRQLGEAVGEDLVAPLRALRREAEG
jgi:hypothetical protein